MSHIKFTTGAPPSIPPSNKVVLFAGTDKTLRQIDENGVVRALAPSATFAKNVTTVATVGATETGLFTAGVPLNNVSVGDIFRVRMLGVSSSNGTLIFRVRAGATGTLTDAEAWKSVTSAAQAANQRAGIDALVAVRAIGAGGKIYCDGLGFAQTVLLPTVVAAPVEIAIDTTVQWYLIVSATCSAGAFTAQQILIEKL